MMMAALPDYSIEGKKGKRLRQKGKTETLPYASPMSQQRDVITTNHHISPIILVLYCVCLLNVHLPRRYNSQPQKAKCEP